jgi:hypothetical protein
MVLGTLLWAGCGASGSGGLDPSTKLVTLTPTEQMQLCDSEAPNGTGQVTCPNGMTMVVNPPDICIGEVISADCAATVADSTQCASKLSTDACSPTLLSDLASVPCLITQSCVGGLCPAICNCSEPDSCIAACQKYTAGLTADCAACIAGLYSAQTCPNFAALPAPYDQCVPKCPGAVLVLLDAGTDRP